MAGEYAAHRIRVNALAPAVTKTNRVLGLIETQPDIIKKTSERQLLGLIEPNDVAMTALFLASDESRTTTGQIFPVDAGFSIS
jgi:NAD(P)-dependent dehydrogenase (short-subunit alcohol dehydrogenase family)